MAKDGCTTQTETFTKATDSTTKQTGLDSTCIRMAQGTSDTGKRTSSTEKGLRRGPTGRSMKVTTRMARKMETEYCFLQMGQCTKGYSKTMTSMGKGNINDLMEGSTKATG